MSTSIPTRVARSRWFALPASQAAVYSSAFRAKRLGAFLALADSVLARAPVCRVLDVGGDEGYWLALEQVWRGRNLDITLVNLDERDLNERGGAGGRFTRIAGDARDLSRWADGRFDVVHSNSVLEHVGTWADMRRMAGEVRRLAPSYFVQTPNYWFPYEAHMRKPFVHWLPRPWQRRVVMGRACGFYPRAGSVDQANDLLASAHLLDEADMRELFPDADITRERVGPLTKSLIATRDGSAALAQA